MSYENYEGLKIRVERGVAFVTIDHPPINLLDSILFKDLDHFNQEVLQDDEVRVIVFDSANSEFFIAHYDVEAILNRPSPAAKEGILKPFHLLLERYRTLPKVTIARIEGRARGAGSEFALALDMRFAASGRAILGQPEVSLGIIPGGGATQRLPRLAGRGRALEIILSAQDVDAELAERYGWVNRALPATEIGPFVEQLAFRIASFSSDAVRLAKEAVDASALPPHDGLLEEAYLFDQAKSTPEAKQRMSKFLESGGQTRQRELDWEWLFQE